ncbi:TolC family protein [Desulfonatronovibrio magnus]|uniref:TolC family protein n=1 Tax=Desulfonatronovibrio magnus TaxID=698827 RepID=UPI0018DBD3E9|nr:TolC family protein [Desulfonatronovibrio magnus]
MNINSYKFILMAVGIIILLWPGWGMAGEDGSDDYSIVLNLEEAVKLGLERSPRIKAREFGVMSREAERKSARGQFLPRLSAGAGYNWVRSTYASGPTDSEFLEQNQHYWNVRLAQTLFAGMTIFNTYQKAKIDKEISELEKESTARQLIREIQYYFLHYLKAGEDVNSLESSIERLEVGIQAAKAFYESRLVPYVDVLHAEVELEETLQNLSRVRNEVKVHQTRLNSLLGLEHDLFVKYQGDIADIVPAPFTDLDLVISDALMKRTDLQFIKKNILSASREKQIARGRKLPTVNLEMSYSERTSEYLESGRDMFGQRYDRDQTNHYWNTGINVQWNFFSGGQQYYRGQSMDYEIKRLQQTLADTEASIITETKTAYLRLEEASNRFASTRKSIAAAKENYSMQEHRFRQRVGTIQDLLNAQVQLTRAEVNRNQALLDYQLALSELYFAMGERNYGLD